MSNDVQIRIGETKDIETIAELNIAKAFGFDAATQSPETYALHT